MKCHGNELEQLATDIIDVFDAEDKFQRTKKYPDLAVYKEKRMQLFLKANDILHDK